MKGYTMNIRHTTKIPFLIKWYMALNGFKALTSFWGVVYYESEKHLNNPTLRAHEMAHVKQMKQEGILKFLVKYNYFWITRGYKHNPYEIEARIEAGQEA